MVQYPDSGAMVEAHHVVPVEEENAELKRVYAELTTDGNNFATWEKLVRAAEKDGHLNRNSSPQALADFHTAFDRFLLKFPLCFGYWKKYAEQEFNIAGPEAAEYVYERGCASVPTSVDLWTAYCSFKMETTHDPEIVRALFERGAKAVGLDYMSHPFWDAYIQFEKRQEADDKVFGILARVCEIPMHQYARYVHAFRELCQQRSLSEMADEEKLATLRGEVLSEAAAYGVSKSEAEVEQDIRVKIDAQYLEICTKTQSETQKRWPLEQALGRLYFHVTELEYAQLAAWHKYLDFEESEGQYERIVFLYERCLTSCALYDEFWFRYVRWMASQPGKEWEVRNIYLRATALFVPLSRPAIRLHFAYWEESCGRVDVARDIHRAVLQVLPDSVEVLVSLAQLERRQQGVEAAVAVLQERLDAPDVELFSKGQLFTEMAYMVWRNKGAVAEARALFTRNTPMYMDSAAFWDKWLDMELEQPTIPDTDPTPAVASPTSDVKTNAKTVGQKTDNKKKKKDESKDEPKESLSESHGIPTERKQRQRIEHILSMVRTKSRLSSDFKKALNRRYLSYLQRRGDAESISVFLQADREYNGPISTSIFAPVAKTPRHAASGSVSGGAGAVSSPQTPLTATGTPTVENALANGGKSVPGSGLGSVPLALRGPGELDGATLQRAEAQYIPHYEMALFPASAGAGPAPFS